MSIVKEDYKISTDWTGSRYLGLNLYWYHEKYELHLYMLDYVAEALK